MSLPPLPQRPTPWSSNVYQANQLLRELYRRPLELVTSGNYNVHRILQHQHSLLEDAIPLLLEVEEAAPNEGLPMSWVNSCADCFAKLLVELENANASASGQ